MSFLVFTGSYGTNPLTDYEKVPLWVGDYVLAGYGTGVVMGVPSTDDRDYRFANHLRLSDCRHGRVGRPEDGKLINSGFLNGFLMGEESKRPRKAREKQLKKPLKSTRIRIGSTEN